jgi:uncharacterized protein with GYD domain
VDPGAATAQDGPLATRSGGSSIPDEEGPAVPTYVTLTTWTDQGVRDAAATVERAEQVRGLVERLGGRLAHLWWTQGRYDLVSVTEAPDDETAAAIGLAVARGGNVRTEMLRAFGAEEMARVLAKLG